ncbi:MAG: hypothetical protein HYT31_02355 [Parcubacteria group bacterium]|nr:hypothetical protein [Parcubacteria group bacterium]
MPEIASDEEINALVDEIEKEQSALSDEKPESAETSDVLSEQEINDLLDDVEQQDKTRQLTPERVAKAWEQLEDGDRAFILTASDEKFWPIIEKFKPKSEKAKIMSALRKLTQANDPRASNIAR